MGFTGLSFTDAMAMKGVSGQDDASVKALLSGNDIILGVVNQSKEFESVKKAVAEVGFPSLLEEKVARSSHTNTFWAHTISNHKHKPTFTIE